MIKKTYRLSIKQGSKRFILKPAIILNKKQRRMHGRSCFIYTTEYRKRLCKQNIFFSIYSLLYQNSWSVLSKQSALGLLGNKKGNQTSTYGGLTFRPRNGNQTSYYEGRSMGTLTKGRLLKAPKQITRSTELNSNHSVSFSKSNAFFNGASLWARSKQTTALKTCPQTSRFLDYSSIKVNVDYFQSDQNKTTSTKKNKLQLAGLVRIRRLRQYYARQLHSTQKYMHWLSPYYKSYKKFNYLICKISKYNQSHGSQLLWSTIMFMDTCWANLLTKSSFIMNPSAAYGLIRHNKIQRNGYCIQNVYNFTTPGDLFIRKNK